MDLFEQQESFRSSAPLAERIRPEKSEELFGQESASRVLSSAEKGVPNLILWGPPGSGKTSFSRVLKNMVSGAGAWVGVNAVDTGAKALKQIGEEAYQRRLMEQRRTYLFIDEIHRLNKAQQDVLLPSSEKGDLTLIGATTENPSYSLNHALLSRCRLIQFQAHSQASLTRLLDKGCEALGVKLPDFLEPAALKSLIELSDGDGRVALNNLEFLHAEFGDRAKPLSVEDLVAAQIRSPLQYDKSSDFHYDLTSALIKSVRGSDPDAGLYYLARMLEGGEDPIFICRRLVILASEDVGNADPRALQVAVSALQAVQLIGLPEGEIPLAQAVTYLASAPKSNRAYLGIKKARELVRKTGSLPVPLALRSAKNSFSRGVGYGRGYKYSHDGVRGFQDQNFFPEALKPEALYEPAERGFEKNISQYLRWLRTGVSQPEKKSEKNIENESRPSGEPEA